MDRRTWVHDDQETYFRHLIRFLRDNDRGGHLCEISDEFHGRIGDVPSREYLPMWRFGIGRAKEAKKPRGA